jgi:hypothetical protein
VAVSALCVWGCGGDSEPSAPPAVTPEDAGRIAATINEVRHALIEGDGAGVCGSLVDEGKQLMIRFARHGEPAADIDSCEEAVASRTPTLSRREKAVLRGPRDFTAADVDLEPADDPGFNDRTDTVPKGGPQTVQVDCLDQSGNAYFAIHQDDGSWKLVLPMCSGR